MLVKPNAFEQSTTPVTDCKEWLKFCAPDIDLESGEFRCDRPTCTPADEFADFSLRQPLGITGDSVFGWEEDVMHMATLEEVDGAEDRELALK